jgi:predicted nucleic acid-binding protein
VPATRHAFTEFPPRSLYLDTNFVLAHLVSTYDYHPAAVRFLAALAASAITTLYVSALSWIEFAHVVCASDFRANLPTRVQQRFQLVDWHQPESRDDYLDVWLAGMTGLLAPFPWYEIGVTDVRVHALQLMTAFNLDGLDATHIACAQAVGVSDIVSFDRDFRRVDGLHLWTA